MASTETTLGGLTFGVALGHQLRRLRREAGISQEAVARRLEMSKETVRRIEAGDGTTTATVEDVLRVLGRTWADVLLPSAATPPYPRGRPAASPGAIYLLDPDPVRAGSVPSPGKAKGLGPRAVASGRSSGARSRDRRQPIRARPRS